MSSCFSGFSGSLVTMSQVLGIMQSPARKPAVRGGGAHARDKLCQGIGEVSASNILCVLSLAHLPRESAGKSGKKLEISSKGRGR